MFAGMNELCSQLMVLGDPLHRGSQLYRIFSVNIKSRGTGYFWYASTATANNRLSKPHRLDQWNAKALVKRWVHQGSCSIKKFGKLLFVQVPLEMHVSSNPKRIGEALQLFCPFVQMTRKHQIPAILGRGIAIEPVCDQKNLMVFVNPKICRIDKKRSFDRTG